MRVWQCAGMCVAVGHDLVGLVEQQHLISLLRVAILGFVLIHCVEISIGSESLEHGVLVH